MNMECSKSKIMISWILWLNWLQVMASFGYTHRLTQPTFGFIFIVELERGDEEKAWFPHLIVYDLVMWNL